jgi:MerR family transcriptional regulator, mercuric resistance operon regulatory protein
MKTKQSEFLTIGELAKSTAVNVETIRFYQRRGLMEEPVKPVGGIRRYGETDTARIRFIKSAQKLGFSLDEVMILLALEDGADCDSAVKIAQKKLVEVKTKITDLRRIEKSLSELVNQCKKSGGEVCCPLISSLQSRRHNDNS